MSSKTSVSVDGGFDGLHTSLDSNKDQEEPSQTRQLSEVSKLAFFRTAAAQVQRKHVPLLEYTQVFFNPLYYSNSNSLEQVSSERVLFPENLHSYKKQQDAQVQAQSLRLQGWEKEYSLFPPAWYPSSADTPAGRNPADR